MTARLPVRSLLLIVSTFLCMERAGYAQQEGNYIIQKRFFSVEDGLASRDVYCAAQDAQGFMWFSTSKGLQRYDGYTFTSYSFPELKDKQVWGMEMFADYLIVCASTMDRSATTDFVLDTKTQTSTKFEYAFPQAPFSASSAFKIDRKGNNIQFLTNNPFALWELNEQGAFYQLGSMPTWKNPNEGNLLNSSWIISDYDRTIVQTASNRDVYIVDKNGSEPLQADTITGKLFNLNGSTLTFQRSISHDASELVSFEINETLGTYELKALANRKQRNETYSFADINENLSSFKAIGLASVFQLVLPREYITLYPADQYKYMTPFGVRSEFVDRQNNYWICCTNGLLQVKLRKNNFTTHLNKQKIGLKIPSEVRGICEFDGAIYANVWTNLWRVEEKATFTIPLKSIGYALAPHANQLFTGTFNDQQVSLTQKNTIPVLTTSDEIWCLFSLNDSLLLVGLEHGLNSYNSKTNTLRAIDSGTINIDNPALTYRILKSHKHGLLAAGDNGVYVLNDQLEFIDYYGMLGTDDNHRMCSTQVYDLYEEPSGDWWLATNGEGLINIHWKGSNRSQGYEKKVFNQTNGLPSDVLYRIERDTGNNLWISTYNGLLRIDTQTHSTKNYSKADGIYNNEFNRTSSCYASNGQMYFGTVDGVVEFNPTTLSADITIQSAALRLTSMSKLDVDVDTLISCTVEFITTGKVELQPHEKSLTLYFTLLDFSFAPHRYAYMIEGMENDWNYISENYIRLNALRYGNYTIRIKAQRADGTWNESELLIPLTVHAPYYAQVWFYPFIIIALGLIFFVFMRLRTQKLMPDKTKLEVVVRNRTATLDRALIDKDVLLKEIHHRVKNNLQVVSGLLQLQKANLHDELAITAINESQMRVNSIALIHQNMYQQENLEDIDFLHFLQDLFKNLKSLYGHEQKQLTFELNAQGIALDIDTAVPLALIANELLTNTYKHAFAQSTNVIATLTLKKLNADEYELTYSDSGPGNPADFNIAQSESLGMQLLQGLSQQLMGTLRYQSGSIHCFSIVFKNERARKRS